MPTPDTASVTPGNTPGIVDCSRDLRAIVDSALAAGEKRITIQPGRYRVKPVDQQHLCFREVEDVEIIADGVEMICTQTTRALTIEKCSNLKIRGLTIDYDPLPYTQGRIVKMSDDKCVHEIELFDGYPDADKVQDFKYEIFCGDSRVLRYGSYFEFESKKLDPKRIEVTRKDGPGYMGEKVGDIIAIGVTDAPGGNAAHAVQIAECKNLVLQDITLYAANCFGFIEHGCTSTHYLRCKVDRRSPETDFVERGDPRIRSLNADAFHSKFAIIGPTYEACAAKFMGDDCINICGDYHMVMKAEGSRLRVLAKGGLNIQKGDPLEVVRYDGTRLEDAKAVEVSDQIDEATEEELDFLSRQQMHPHFTGGHAVRIFEVVIDREIDLPLGSVIASANRNGNGFMVTGCDFGFNRSRGILIKASNGTVKDNRMELCWGEAIKVAPEYFWLESGSSNNVTIKGNTILNCIRKGIAVYAWAGTGDLAPAGAHNDIVIENNTITNTREEHIWVTSTKGLVLRNNELGKDKLKLENCEDVEEAAG